MSRNSSRAPKSHNRVYAFIDSQNLNLGVQKDLRWANGKIRYKGWRLDFVKFRRFLKDKYHVEKAFLFIGFVEGNEELYRDLAQAGYIVVSKPTTSFKNQDGEEFVKGNVDTDLVLHAAAKEFPVYDKAVIVSGDGDFLSLYDFLEERDKLDKILVPSKLSYSQLLNKYGTKLDYISPNRGKLERDRVERKREESHEEK